MGDLTKNLSRHEFACKCGCGFNTADFELVTALQNVVDQFERIYGAEIVIDITGPNRCKEHNETVQKIANPQYVQYTSKSRHMISAADFKLMIKGRLEQIDPDEIADYLESKYPGKFGIGRYKSFTHLDPRTVKARWGK